MNAQEIIELIATSKKKTPVKVYLQEKEPVDFPDCRRFGNVIFGEWEVIEPVLRNNKEKIIDCLIEADRRNSALPLMDFKPVEARIEPGALIRGPVKIGKNAVIMMGAILNIGAEVGEGTMIDMGAILGGRATVKNHCHIGAGAVLAGVIEPASATPVIVEDNVLVGANAVVIEGVHIGHDAVVAAGAIVIEDVPPYAVVAGCPAKIIKMKDEKAASKTALVDALREL